jgi:hypothetical protein
MIAHVAGVPLEPEASRSGGEVAAVDCELGAGDVDGVVGGEEGDG